MTKQHRKNTSRHRWFGLETFNVNDGLSKDSIRPLIKAWVVCYQDTVIFFTEEGFNQNQTVTKT